MPRAIAAGMAIGAAVLLSACSSITDGTSQQITMTTNPTGARCEFMREGKVVAVVERTPGTVTVQRTKHDIAVTCAKEGFQSATFDNKSDIASNTFGNIIMGGVVGWAVDSASGADNHYTPTINLTLIPTSLVPAAAPAPAASGDSGKASSPAS